MSMQSLTITIGRNKNTNQKPMPAYKWNNFIRSAVRVASIPGADIVVQNEGRGSWTDTATNITYSEDNFIVMAIRDYPGNKQDVIDRKQVTRKLKQLAGAYWQDTIAVSWGRSDLVSA